MIWTQQQITQWSEKTFGMDWDAGQLAARANTEMAEVMAHSADHADGWKDQVLEECADVMIVLYRLASKCGGDLQSAVDRKMEINIKRKWDLDGNGRGKHA